MIYCKEHAKTTLMSWSKKELVDHIQCLEHNNNALEERLEIQAQNCLKLLKEERKQVCDEIRKEYSKFDELDKFDWQGFEKFLNQIEKDQKIERLKEKYKAKMLKSINNNDCETGHQNCDTVLCELLEELGFAEVVNIYNQQECWFA